MKKLIMTTILLMTSKSFSQGSELLPIDIQPTAHLKALCRTESLGATYEIYDTFGTGTFQNACVRIISDDGNIEKKAARSQMFWSGMSYSFEQNGKQNSFYFQYDFPAPTSSVMYQGGFSVPTVCEVADPSAIPASPSEVCP